MTINIRELRAIHAKNILNIAGVKEYGKLLDIGCGNGDISESFRRDGAVVIGIDPNPKILPQKSECTFLVMDGTDLKFPNFSFDTIIINDVLEHVSYYKAKKLLSEAKRVLKLDGKIYISVMNRWEFQEPHCRIPLLTWFPRFLWNPIYSIFVKSNKKYRESYFPYTKNQIFKLIKNTGLETIDYTYIYGKEKVIHPEQIGSRVIRNLVKMMNKIGLKKQAINIARKFSVLIFVCYYS
jgi:ubiquinone/menaquinone biosynthesis C-methylase UbiE